MGSTQSSTSLPPPNASMNTTTDNNNHAKIKLTNDATNSNPNNDKVVTTNQEKKKKKKSTPPKNLTGYALIEYKCRKKRARYDQCYQQTHSAFVVGKKLFDKDGDEIDHKTSCEDLFEDYKDCIYRGMMKDRKERGVGVAKPESALGDYFDNDEEK